MKTIMKPFLFCNPNVVTPQDHTVYDDTSKAAGGAGALFPDKYESDEQSTVKVLTVL
ncbi:hypothetical protein [Halodesulfovibrio aestuarii]|uniref:hypothetical protein n=1 Tax=Halodesulfovibrio aestuarii TaxID=126333 RepID=UPI0012B53F6C